MVTPARRARTTSALRIRRNLWNRVGCPRVHIGKNSNLVRRIVQTVAHETENRTALIFVLKDQGRIAKMLARIPDKTLGKGRIAKTLARMLGKGKEIEGQSRDHKGHAETNLHVLKFGPMPLARLQAVRPIRLLHKQMSIRDGHAAGVGGDNTTWTLLLWVPCDWQRGIQEFSLSGLSLGNGTDLASPVKPRKIITERRETAHDPE